MRKVTASFALSFMILFASAVPGAQEKHIRATLAPVGGSGVSGFVQLTSVPQGSGTNIVVVAKGLQEGASYAALFHESANCSGAGDLIGTFVANGSGGGSIQGTVSNSIEQVGSVSVRLGSGTLQACGNTR